MILARLLRWLEREPLPTPPPVQPLSAAGDGSRPPPPESSEEFEARMTEHDREMLTIQAITASIRAHRPPSDHAAR